MSQSSQELKKAMAIVEQLPPTQQKLLVSRLLEKTHPEETALIIYLKRLSPQKQERLEELLEKNSEGEITKSEKAELRKLNDEVGRMTLENSIELLRVLRPDAYKKQSRKIKAAREKFLSHR